MEHWFAVNPLYTERQARCNIFFPQIMKSLVGSNVHQEHRRQAMVAFANLRVFVAAMGEEAVHSLFDHLDLDCLSRFHLEPTYQSPQRSQQISQIIFKYFIYLKPTPLLLNWNKVFAPKESS
jgi:hypothetical protein